ncbi:hypothetical protein CC80DRAFT_491650 [Byssothecium circinans]|uniref:TM7S3/TM198-like domain-containing protein n=1 Tax=Byssothecium circinans TaxID=147558 RepID=A0A6A5TY48_9PLEO|nr:hypothetical protein CC80DRAFT_491650 [Byssothecium circinans]
MLPYHYLISFFALILCFHSVSAAPAFERRQDGNVETPTATVAETTRPSSTSAPTSSRASRSSTPTEATPSPTVISASISATQTSTTTASNAPSASASSPPAADSQDALPIQPKITPALGLAGIIMLISGIIYGVIGIKNKWLYVFGSAAYLTSLAVTVLIVYLMSSPVTNAVQGAFFVAALLSGLILGALALVFADVTDGLGCLLGGFCISMWFLTLKDGGLIGSTGGCAIFIGCMSLAGFALSWSHYTRNYGLIVCISFAGATVTILGIDCFSRAGLKEFWLYIWNLNPDIFPLHTDTYPMTRGIKAELAGTIILTVFGIISQLKVWKLVKEHRLKSEAQRLERARDQELEEEERGRRIEDKFQKERMQWEATYNKGAQVSSMESGTSTPKAYSSIQEKDSVRSGSVELTQVPQDGLPQSTTKRDSVTVTVGQDDEISHIDGAGNPLPKRPELAHQNTRLSIMGSPRASSEVMGPGRLSRSISERSSLKPSAPPPPPTFVPLPFKVPQQEDFQSEVSDNASISAVPDVPEEQWMVRRSISKRVSDAHSMKRASTSSPLPDRLDPVEDFVVPHIEDDRASSVAATLDDDLSLRELSPPSSPLEAKFDNNAISARTAEDNAANQESVMGLDTCVEESDVEEANPPELAGPRQSLTASTDPKSGKFRSSPAFASSVQGDSPGLQQSQTTQPSTASSQSQPEQHDSATGSLKGALPPTLSKIAQAYRVNEWSKHLEAAEKPDLDDIEEPDSPGIQIDHERPAPVSEELVQPLVKAKRNSNRVSVGVQPKEKFTRSDSNTSKTSTLAGGGVSRVGAQAMNRLSGNSSLQPPSPRTSITKRLSSAPTPTANTLMSQRESLIRNRTSSQSLLPQSASANNLAQGDDMTLAQRRRALQHQKPPSASQKWQKGQRVSSNPIQSPVFDSHQPKRSSNATSDQRREDLLVNWRESIRQTSTAPVEASVVTVDEQQQQRRAALMHAKRQKETEKQQRAMVAQQRESMMHNMMRSNEMLDAHRDAMRRMQSAANRNA